MKRLSIVMCLMITSILAAQNFENSWTGYFSYVRVNSISQGNDKIFAAAENSVFSYDLSTLETNTTSTIQGLDGGAISTSLYSSANNLLAIGYENGLIEIVIDGEENILTVVDILDQQSIPPDEKRINHFHEFDNKLYISTGYGISVYNLETLEFGDTYIIGANGSRINITQTTILPPVIYAASSDGGILSADVNNPDLIDFAEWNTLVLGNYSGIQTLENEIYALRDDNTVFSYNVNDGFIQVQTYSQQVRSFTSNDGILAIGLVTFVEGYSEGFNLQVQLGAFQDFPFSLRSAYAFDNKMYIGTTNFGVLEVPFGSFTPTQILPEGPIRNAPFALDTSPGQLWVNFGEVDVDFNPFEPELSRFGISNLREGQWTNLPYNEIFEANDLVNVSINPEDPNEVYMTSFNKGLLKIEDQTAVSLTNEDNSVLQSFRDDLDTRLYGSAFDRQGNLWFTQSKVERGLARLSTGDQITTFDVTDIIPDAPDQLALTEVAISREGSVFFGSSESGLGGYNPQTDTFNIYKEEGNVLINNIRALAFDQNNRLWIGSLEGLRVLFNTSGFFDLDNPAESQPIIILDGDVPQELLASQSIVDIQVDGSNNKWIATSTSGVFYLSPNGQETLLRFTTENSPLPSDNVQDIAIDSFTGAVYFATTNGLVAFNGSATAPRENLEEVFVFPNPVRPGFTGNVTIDGLTANANVKITDLEGNLVFEETSQGGSVLWDTSAFGQYQVRSGVYLAIITAEDQIETKVAKIMVVR